MAPGTVPQTRVTDAGKLGETPLTDPGDSKRPGRTPQAASLSCPGAQVSAPSLKARAPRGFAALEILGVSFEVWKPFHSGALA